MRWRAGPHACGDTRAPADANRAKLAADEATLLLPAAARPRCPPESELSLRERHPHGGREQLLRLRSGPAQVRSHLLAPARTRAGRGRDRRAAVRDVRAARRGGVEGAAQPEEAQGGPEGEGSGRT